MAGKDRIVMSQQESNRLHVIRQAIEKAITQKEAARELGYTERQVRRMVKRVREEGALGICHRSRGRKPNNWISEAHKEQVLAWCRSRYVEFGPTHVCEKLNRSHRIRVSRETVRKWFMKEGVAYRSRRNRPHRQWRRRKAHRGEMVQMDGSRHAWFEGRGPMCVLMGYVDDATGRVYARLYEYEGTLPALDGLKRYIKRYGIPRSVYLDRHTTYKAPGSQTVDEQLGDSQPMSQFERCLGELGVEVIHAYSPQAKGRIERLFGTFQDRVVKEMRLAGVTMIAEGNAFLNTYLPEYNRMFAREPEVKADFHRPVVDKRALDGILSIKTEHALRNDFTVAHNKKLYQVVTNVRTKKVVVEERTDGRLYILHNGQRLQYTEIARRPKKHETESVRIIHRRKQPLAHPWKSPARAMVHARLQRQAVTQNRTF